MFDFLTDVYVPEPRPDLFYDEPAPTLPVQVAEPPPLTLPVVPTASQPTVKTKKREMTYANSEDLIIIQNRLLHAISNLTLNERRLILFLSPIVRKGSDILDEKGREVFRVDFSDFANEYGLNSKNSVYKILRETSDSIINKGFFYWHIKKNQRKSRVGLSWLTKCEYQENSGFLEIILSDEVIEMLTVFDESTGNYWTKYQKDWITRLGTYGIIMLELVLSSFDKNVKGYYTIEHLREKFNCSDRYPMFSDFKIWVIDKAVKEIEKNTPIKISYEKHKAGRAVIGLSFSYTDTSIKSVKNKEKNDDKPKENNPFTNFKMTPKQLAVFGAKIAKKIDKDIEIVIDEMSNVHFQGQYVEYLKLLDFVPSDWYTEDEIKDHPTAEQIAQAKKKAKQEAERQEELEQAQLKQDYETLLANAEEFVLANQKRLGFGIEKMYFNKGDYQSVVRSWEHYLLDKQDRKGFAMLNEILSR
ncbi:replication initiation protein [Moraxella oculi]|uniref:Replication initiation protein n=1 Tax=Moraxella oculi TaxID=2940516 RepID=A0ABW8U7A5_9GAMM